MGETRPVLTCARVGLGRCVSEPVPVSASYAGGHENLKDLKDSLTFLVAKVRFWDVASGKEVRQVAGQEFWFAEGPEGSEGKGGQFLLSVSRGNTVLITALPPLEGVSLGQTPLDPSGVSPRNPQVTRESQDTSTPLRATQDLGHSSPGLRVINKKKKKLRATFPNLTEQHLI